MVWEHRSSAASRGWRNITSKPWQKGTPAGRNGDCCKLGMTLEFDQEQSAGLQKANFPDTALSSSNSELPPGLIRFQESALARSPIGRPPRETFFRGGTFGSKVSGSDATLRPEKGLPHTHPRQSLSRSTERQPHSLKCRVGRKDTFGSNNRS